MEPDVSYARPEDLRRRPRGRATVVLFALLALAAGCASDGPEVTSAPLPEATQPEYRIGPGDNLQIFVWGHQDLNVTVPVRPDGMISTPLVDNVKAEGKTAGELAKGLEAALQEYVRGPKVNVLVTGFVGALGDQVRVVGQAAQPRALPYRAGMTVLDVMIAVGGLSNFAAGNRAVIVRREGDTQVRIPLRLDDLLNDGDIGANVAIRPGDVLIIPESRF
jgi:polysaccharide export outer membrane protein